MTYDTYLEAAQVALLHPCITIIDTIILHIHTNNAYIYDTYLEAAQVALLRAY
jgi:hypothetical protein